MWDRYDHNPAALSSLVQNVHPLNSAIPKPPALGTVCSSWQGRRDASYLRVSCHQTHKIAFQVERGAYRISKLRGYLTNQFLPHNLLSAKSSGQIRRVLYTVKACNLAQDFSGGSSSRKFSSTYFIQRNGNHTSSASSRFGGGLPMRKMLSVCWIRSSLPGAVATVHSHASASVPTVNELPEGKACSLRLTAPLEKAGEQATTAGRRNVRDSRLQGVVVSMLLEHGLWHGWCIFLVPALCTTAQ